MARLFSHLAMTWLSAPSPAESDRTMRQNKTKTDKEKIAALVAWFSDLIGKSEFTQTEIARELSDEERDYQQTYISLMRSGRTKIPIYLIPKLSAVLKVNTREFLDKALEAYHPEIHEIFRQYAFASLSENETRLIELYRETIRDERVELNAAKERQLVSAFKALDI